MLPLQDKQCKNRSTLIVIAVLALGVFWTFISRVPPAASTNSLTLTDTTPARIENVPASSAHEGFIAPDFTLARLGGEEIALSALRGKVVMVNWWASWCPPCRAEMPAIESVYQTYQAQGLEVLAVNTTYQDDETAAAAFAQTYKLTFPILLDRTGETSKRYLLQGLPTTFFIDRAGIIRAIVVGGPMSEATIQSNVEALLKEQP